MSRSLPPILFFARFVILRASDADVPLTLLAASSPGKCMDGTPGGFYFAKATSPESSNKWIFDLEGGGECVTNSSCKLRLSTKLGSSKYFKSSTELHFLASGDSAANPYAHTWNRVFIKYCSQDLWSGTRTERSEESFGLYFSGHIIIQEVFKDLLAESNLKEASDVVITGESAGGIGSWLNVGWFRQQLPEALTVVAPIAGFYAYAFPYDGPSAGPAGLADFAPAAWQHHFALWQSHVDEDCRNDFPEMPWHCMLANNSRKSIRAPAFVVEAQTDKVQLEAHDSIPMQPWSKYSAATQADIRSYVQAWQHNMTGNIHSRLYASDGYFFPACFIHTEFSKDGPFITDPVSGKEYTYSEAFGKWLQDFKAGKQNGFRLEDSCGLFCGKCSAEHTVLV